MLSFILLNRTSWVAQSAKGGRKLHLIIYPETRNLSKIQHGLSMMPLMRLKVSLMQTYHGDSVGYWKPLTIVMQVKGNGSISTDYLVVKNLNIGPLEKKKEFFHDVPCPGWIVRILGQIPLGLGIAWCWEPRKGSTSPPLLTLAVVMPVVGNPGVGENEKWVFEPLRGARVFPH